jgi:hypothetical protein
LLKSVRLQTLCHKSLSIQAALEHTQSQLAVVFLILRWWGLAAAEADRAAHLALDKVGMGVMRVLQQ